MGLPTLRVAQHPVSQPVCRTSRNSPWRRVHMVAAWLLPLLLTACATYHPRPLPAQPDLLDTPPLTVPVSQLRIPGLEPHPFDPSNGLDATEVVILAVVNNPMLKAARRKAGVAQAELFSAGLLPDPQLSIGLEFPISGVSSLTNGYSLGVAQILTSLVTRGAAVARARAHVRQVNLHILWQEWQVAQKARELFIEARTQTRLRQVFRQARRLSLRQYHRDQAALKRGNVTLATVSADLVGLINANTRLCRLKRQASNTRHALHLLLGLETGVELHLVGDIEPAPLSQARFKTAVATLAQRRADLLALHAGYQSQEQALRKAILSQFPAFHVGLTQTVDTDGVHTIGIDVSLSLPVFNRNRGAIAVQRATRAALYHAYQARLDEAVNNAHRVWSAIQIMTKELKALYARLADLRQMTSAAERSFQRGSLAVDTYIRLRSSLLAKRADAIRLHASLAKARAALMTLLGMPFQALVAFSALERSSHAYLE